MDRRVALSAALGLHLAAAVAHGSTHALVPVWQTPGQQALVLATTFLGPIAGVVLAWRDHPLGVPLFTASMAGALLVGGVLHYLVENPDHVLAIPPGAWQVPFRVTAAGVAITSALGVVTGAWAWNGP